MKRLAQGFTLVELLIVIALLGVIATIVIAAINPIEQANRAADAGMKADASQLVSAVQRYYASHSEFPWNSCTGGGCTPLVSTAEGPLPWTSADAVGIGICGTAGTGCKAETTHGVLITSLELQTAFLSKSWIGPTSALPPNELLVGKGTGASSSVYVCWIPKANSNRQNLINSASTRNKMVTTLSSIGISGVPDASTACTTTSDPGWTSGACSECVPE